MAYTILNEDVYTFDVDDTLVLWGTANYQRPSPDLIEFNDPYDGAKVYLRPHHRHIKLLKQMKGRGRYVVVWSQGGAKWAREVVKTLGLSNYVDLIITKPHGYVDDLPCEAWLRNRIYIDEVNTDVE